MYLVLGTTEFRIWRRAFSGGATIAELREHMAERDLRRQLGRDLRFSVRNAGAAPVFLILREWLR